MASALHILYPSESYKLDKIRSPLPSVPVGAGGGGLLTGLFADRMATTGPFGPMALPVPLACLQPKLGAHPDNPGLDIWLQLTRGAGGPPPVIASAAPDDVRFRPSPPRGDYPQTELPDSPCDLRVSPRPLQALPLVKAASYNSKSPPSAGPGAPTANGGGPTVKRRGRGKERIWTQIECFNNDAQAKAFVQAERTWVMQKKTQVQEGTKVYYECSKYRSAKCPAAVSILYHANSDRVSVFRASGDHNHAPLEPRHNNKNSNNATHSNGTVSTTTSHQSHGNSSSINVQGRPERPEGSSSVIKNGQEIARMALQANGGEYSPPVTTAGPLSYKMDPVTPTLHRPVATYPMKRPEPLELRHKFKQHVIGLTSDGLMAHSHPHIRAPEPTRAAHFDYASYHLQQQYSPHHHHHHHNHNQQQQQQLPQLPQHHIVHAHHNRSASLTQLNQLDSNSPPLMGFRPLPRDVKLSRSRSRTRSRSRSRDDEDDGGRTPQSDARLTDSSHESGSESSASCSGSSSNSTVASTVATTATTITRHSVISRTPSAPLPLSLLPDGSSRCFVTNCRSNHLADHHPQQLPATVTTAGGSPSSSGVSCSSSESSLTGGKISPVAMLHFPKDLLKRMVWSMNVNKSNADGSLCIAASGDLICAAHFSRDRFDVFPGVLKPDAVPTLFGSDLVLTLSEGTHDPEQTDCKVTTSKEVPVRRTRTARKRAHSASLLRRLQRAQHTVDKLRLSNRAHRAKINILRRIVNKIATRKEQTR